MIGSAIVNIIESECGNNLKTNNDIMQLMNPIRIKLDENIISGDKLWVGLKNLCLLKLE